MLTLARAGADVLPACPGFYHRPASVSDLVDFIASRALSRAGIDAGILAPWGSG
jgi:flavin prenyltransferase